MPTCTRNYQQLHCHCIYDSCSVLIRPSSEVFFVVCSFLSYGCYVLSSSFPLASFTSLSTCIMWLPCSCSSWEYDGEPLVVLRVGMSPPKERWAQRELGPGEWHPGRGHDVRIVLKPYHHLFCWTLTLVLKSVATFYLSLSSSILTLHILIILSHVTSPLTPSLWAHPYLSDSTSCCSIGSVLQHCLLHIVS